MTVKNMVSHTLVCDLFFGLYVIGDLHSLTVFPVELLMSGNAKKYHLARIDNFWFLFNLGSYSLEGSFILDRPPFISSAPCDGLYCLALWKVYLLKSEFCFFGRMRFPIWILSDKFTYC